MFINQASKKSYSVTGKASISKDMMTSISYSQNSGILVTYFNGNFKLFDSINYSLKWH